MIIRASRDGFSSFMKWILEFLVLDSGRFEIFVLGLNIFEIFYTLDGICFDFLIGGASFGFGLIIN